jgi:glycosyltransferase involved in cell wall biosynthesis
MVVDEAKFFGKPVIASAIGGIPERLLHGVDGYLVPPGDVVGLAEAMDRFLRGAELKPRPPEGQSWPVISAQYRALFFAADGGAKGSVGAAAARTAGAHASPTPQHV